MQLWEIETPWRNPAAADPSPSPATEQRQIQFNFPCIDRRHYIRHLIDTSPACSDSEHDPAATEVEVITPRSESLSSSAIGGSIAVAKESDDPYQDFQDSMLRMILKKGIYSSDGLEALLRCFLELNSPCYHEVGDHPGILRDMAWLRVRSQENTSSKDQRVKLFLEVNAM